MLDELASLGHSVLIALMIAIGISVAVVTFQAILRYTKPNIGYHHRDHRRFDRTFFIRNLDSTHYHQSLHIIVSGIGLRYVAVHAGPWCSRRPAHVASESNKVQVRVVFDEVPEDASFALRAIADGGMPTIEIESASPLQSRRFAATLSNFSTVMRLRYYASRFFSGYVSFLLVFFLSVWMNDHRVWTGDWVLGVAGGLISLISFVLVVPYRGKSTVVGYLGPVDVGRYWGDRSMLVTTASGRISRIRDSIPGPEA